MSKSIECPLCHFNFEIEDNCDLHECPNCGAGVMYVSSLERGQHEQVVEFEECVAESWSVLQDLKEMDDESLEDEIAEEVSLGTYMKGTFNIFSEMESTGYMAYDTRCLAEGVYLLMYTTKMYGYEQ